MYTSIFLRRRTIASAAVPQLLTFLRHMGGGPRTFPGGLNKWQWKRMHEKKAKEKEKKLLEQEKQLYQARIRSQIRSKLSQPDPTSQHDPNLPNYKPLSPQDHIKALADRFMKEGAEDLWNEADGPIKSQSAQSQLSKKELTSSPIDVGKLISGSRNLASNIGSSACSGSNNLSNLLKPRHYSVVASHGRIKTSPRLNYRRKESSSSDDDSDDSDVVVGTSGENGRRGRVVSNGRHLLDEEGEEGGRGSVRRMVSSAALGKYDRTIKKRVPLRDVEDEDDLSLHVQAIRSEFNKRRDETVGANGDEESILSQKRFDQCSVSPLTVKALTAAGYVQMTRVQEATMSAYLEGQDAFVKAKTGTGKSAAFLIPAIETVLKALSSKPVQRVPPVYVLILCPTRELASQIAAEANVMIKYHDGIGVQTLVGGTRFKVDQKRLESDPCQIIVATPGRLLDHVENKSGISVRLMGLKLLIVDEADHLLDLGFRRDMEKIVDCLPRQKQSLLFSATIPKEVRRISQLVLKREHAYIDTVGVGCLETHAKVNQSYLVAPHEEHFQIVHHLLKEHTSQVLDYKVILFCTTAMMTSLMYSLLHEMKLNVREIHSKKSPLYRTRVSDEFRESKLLILVTSDVSARGMNYPDVTLVVQVGIPCDREQYIHRLGRTGREGKGGEGVLLLAPWEAHFLDEIKDLPLNKASLPHLDPAMKVQIKGLMTKIDTSLKEAAYHAWLGYYNSNREIGRDKTTLVELANGFCESMGLQTPPSLFRKTALKMGLKGIPGIRIRK
ncbi:hypothetical protein RJ639_010029 [Escallonia herrerae]|uniref:ATP-dependent RNA helicase n=1 Tax=Escallonia herrerae TaxID=1293975 RepID=A0AA88VRI2_9ASTE|nr:hypothetical protein RJ639_010029 [Escallonia herrerae]